MAENRQYDYEYKVQAVKLAKEIGLSEGGQRIRDPQEYHVWIGTG